jgi:tetratricopeptide (TPR) repeat protein
MAGQTLIRAEGSFPQLSAKAVRLRGYWAPLLLLTGAVFAANVNVLSAGFAWDDRALIIGNSLIRSWRHIPEFFQQSFLGMYYRPVVMASFVADYALWGLRPWGYHLTNLLLHAINTLLAFFLLVRLTQNRRLAFIAALLFAVHPAHKGVVAIADRTGILSAFFFLAALLLYVTHRQIKRKGLSLFFYGSALLSCSLAFFSKEETLALPIILFAIDYLLLNRKKPFFLVIRTIIPFFLTAAFYVFVRSIIAGAGTGLFSAFLIEPARRLVTIPAILLKYLVLLVYPIHLDYEPRVPLGWIGEPRILIALPVFMILASLALRNAKRSMAAFGFLWYLIVFLPMSNVIPIYPEAARSHLFTPIHFLYLPSVGIFLCAAAGIEAIFKITENNSRAFLLKAGASAFLCLLLFTFSVLSLQRNFIWSDELRLYQYIVKMHPENPRMRLNLGNVYLERKRVDEALDQLKQAVMLAPDVANFRNSLALAYKDKGWYDRSVEEFQQALKLDPQSLSAYINLTAVYRMKKETARAIEAASKAVELSPASALAHTNLALAYIDAGELAEAEKHLSLAIEVDPACAEAHNAMGILFARKNQYDPAKEQWSEALRIRPDLAEARENLQMLERMGL